MTEPAVVAGKAQPISVVVVDSQLMFAECLKKYLDDEPDLEVQALAKDGAQALSLAARLQPQVFLVDFFLPDMDGAELTRRLKAELPSVEVVIITGFSSDNNLVAAIEAGCAGFLSKDRRAAEAVAAVRSVAAGELLISGPLLSRLLNRIGGFRDHDVSSKQLSTRELEILQELSQGYTNRMVAEHLHISVHTVRNHVQSILLKLEAHSKLEAVTIGVRSGLISLPGT